MNIGIVGHAADKFTPETEKEARRIIFSLLENGEDSTVVSGACHLGGVDIWAEWQADAFGLPKIIHPPATHAWATGYKPRNLLIARDSDEVHVIVVREYPPEYSGMRFASCYHCHTSTHIKSGACWTARQAMKLGKRAVWHEITTSEPKAKVTSSAGM